MKGLLVSAVLAASLAACGGKGAARDSGGADALDASGVGGAGGAIQDGAAGAVEPSTDGSADVADVPAASDASDVAGPEVPDALPDALGPDSLPAGKLAFDVQAGLSIVPPAGQEAAWTTFPRTVPFTFVWNATAATAIAGAAGGARAAAIESAGDGFFRTAPTLSVNILAGTSCGPAAFDNFEIVFSTDGASFTGTARGNVTYQTSDTVWTAPATAVLVGKLDTTPPTLSVPQSPVDPLAPLVFAASEPMPSTAVASIVSRATGEIPNLAATFINGAGAAITFTAPNLALRPGDTYDVHLGPDFAGNQAPTTMSFTTAAAPPLVPDDGFESVTGTMFAGAGVLHGGPLTPISGQTSLLLNTGFGGGFGFLPYDLGPSVAVRLAVSRGDTVVRFDTQLIAPDPIDSAAFVGTIRVASFQGLSVSLLPGVIGSSMNVSGTDFVKQTLPQLGDVYISPVKTVEIALPPGAADQDELTFEIAGVTFQCSAPPSPTVLVLDNLRVE
jgi:hypothetical protein